MWIIRRSKRRAHLFRELQVQFRRTHCARTMQGAGVGRVLKPVAAPPRSPSLSGASLTSRRPGRVAATVKALVPVSLALGLLAGCSSLLPKSTETSGDTKTAWRSYQEAEASFASITPGKTTVDELRAQHLDPRANANMRVVPRYEVVQRFIVNSTITLADLDEGVRQCLEAREACTAWEINQQAMQKKSTGNAALHMLKVQRETQNAGWRFCGLLLMKDGVVIYKLTSGQPGILEVAQDQDILAPLQIVGSKFNALNGIEVTDVRNGVKSTPSATPSGDAVMAVRRR